MVIGGVLALASRDVAPSTPLSPDALSRPGLIKEGFSGELIKAQVERSINSNRLFLNVFVGSTRII
jgi:hypothetical protein